MTNAYEIAHEFAKEFAELEHALKRTGFLLAKAKDARADWGRFSEALGEDFFAEIQASGIAPTILAHPPRQLMRDGLKWEPENPAPITTVAGLIEKGICRIRNNYLHGEKFTGGPDSTHWGRDVTLVTEALAVLRAACQHLPRPKGGA